MKTFFVVIILACSFSLFGQTQVVSGNVYDEISMAPIPGAAITLLNDSTGRGVLTDSSGSFRVPEVPAGRNSFRVTAVGYESQVVYDVMVNAGKGMSLRVPLREALQQLKEVEITHYDNKAANKMALLGARSLNIDEARKYAGSFEDPSRMAASYAGVISGNDARNDIVVRGNSPSGMLWQMDGLNIPNPNHFGSLGTTGGPVSMLNSNVLARSDFFTGAFPAQYGNALSGVLDLKMRDGNAERQEFLAQLGFNGFEAGAEGPVSKKKKTTYLINYRYSTLGVFKALGINFGTGLSIPFYQDVNYKLTTQLSRKSKLSLFGIAGTSSIEFKGNDIDSTKSNLYSDPFRNLKNSNATTVTGLTYEWLCTEKTVMKLTAGYATTSESGDVDSISYKDRSVYANATADFKTRKLSLVSSLSHKLDSRNSLQAGITYDHTRFSMYNKKMSPEHTDRIYIDNEGNYGLLQGYAQWRGRVHHSFTFTGGIQAQYLTLNKDLAAGFRANLRYTPGPAHALALGYGLHYQVQNIYTYYLQTPVNNEVLYTNKDLKATRSQHFILSYDWMLNPLMVLKLEAYYQKLGRAPVEQNPTSFSALNNGGDFGVADADSLVNKGSGYNYGIDITLERFFNNGFYFLGTGSVFRSRYKGSDGVERNTTFNAGYVGNLLAGKEFNLKGNQTFFINLKMTTVGGRRLTPVDLEKSKVTGAIEYRKEQAFSQREPAYFRLDLKVGIKKEFKHSTLEFNLDIQNVTNRKNVYMQAYDARAEKTYYLYQQGFFPVPSVRFIF